MGILDTLGIRAKTPPSAAGGDTETVRKIASALDRLDPERARYLAAFAYLLTRVASADLKVSEDETRTMERIVMEKGSLPEEQAIMVVQMAKTQSLLFGGVENFLVTREFREIASVEQRIALLHCLFAVSAADHVISFAEEGTIGKIASELMLDHADYVAVKGAYRERLATLRSGD
jgi:uncharacterized tellurite resistance protein B-like protein